MNSPTQSSIKNSLNSAVVSVFCLNYAKNAIAAGKFEKLSMRIRLRSTTVHSPLFIPNFLNLSYFFTPFYER